MHCVRWSVIAAVGSAIGCGPVVATDTDSGSDDAGTASTSSVEVGESSANDGDASDGGVDQTGDDDGSTGTPLATLCGREDPLAPIAVLAAEDAASVLRADGSMLPLDLPSTPPPADATLVTSFDARGPRVAFARAWTVLADGLQHGSDVALLASTGERVWTREEPDATVAGLYLGTDGSIVATRGVESGGSEGVMFTMTGDAIALPDFYPVDARRDDGWVPGQLVSARGIPRQGWIAPERAAVRDVSFEMHGAWFVMDDGRFVYLALAEAGPALVREGPRDLELTPLVDLGAADVDALWISVSGDRSWVLVGRNDGSAWWRASLDDGEVEPLQLSPAFGFTTLECYAPEASIDDAGRILLAVRDASSAAVHRLDPGVRAWEPLGEPVTEVDAIGASAYGDTYVVRSDAQGTTFCPPQSFEPGPAALAGAILQLVRPVDGVAQVFAADTAWATPSPDGLCVAIVDPRSTTLLDLGRDTELALGGVALTWWRRSP